MCSDEKSVGEAIYRKIDEQNTTMYNCMDDCIYENIDVMGSKFCFREENLPVECCEGE